MNELDLQMHVDRLILEFVEAEGSTAGCARWIRKNLEIDQIKALCEYAIEIRAHDLLCPHCRPEVQ